MDVPDCNQIEAAILFHNSMTISMNISQRKPIGQAIELALDGAGCRPRVGGHFVPLGSTAVFFFFFFFGRQKPIKPNE